MKYFVIMCSMLVFTICKEVLAQPSQLSSGCGDVFYFQIENTCYDKMFRKYFAQKPPSPIRTRRFFSGIYK